jgi:uncharacterized membrane protein (UPF0136 family)
MKKTGHWIVAYGSLLIVIGLIGYLSNPEKARTALISGGTFGTISIIWGLLSMRYRWAVIAAFVTSSFLAVIFIWRASVGWMAVAQGDTAKVLAAALISLMLMASLSLLVLIAKRRFERDSGSRQ